ncbi:DciA family protein [Streptomyces sp. NPDC127100]|uniref:DciA family protein n=1 Tax=Streptomyces sp. NPDC127100 TaxID=3347138 RepID=UPI0036615DCC
MTSDGPSSSGVDLARIALRQAKEAARQRGGQAPAQKARRTVRLHRSDRRDPQPLQGLLQQWLVDNGYEKAADGGSLLNRWPDIVGAERAAHWEAAAYDEASKTLTVVCQSDSWARMLSLVSRQIVEDVNRALKPGTLAAIRIRKGTYRPPVRPEPASASEPSTRRVPPGTAPTEEYARVREQLQDAKAQRDAAAPRRHYERLTPDRIQADPDDHTEAQYFQQGLEEEARRKADSHARALRYARRQRAASGTATTAPTPRRSSGAA